MSQVIFCTSKLPVSRFIRWFNGGYSHAALVLPNGNWLDARFSGVKERSPETNLYAFEVVDIPFDIEPTFRKLVGKGYNFRGVIAQWLHFKWSSPGKMFCNQAVLAACRLVGHQVVDEGREDKVGPQACCDLLKAYLRGINCERSYSSR